MGNKKNEEEQRKEKSKEERKLSIIDSFLYNEDRLLCIFNACPDMEYFLKKWKIADLRLVYKGGDKNKQLPKSNKQIPKSQSSMAIWMY